MSGDRTSRAAGPDAPDPSRRRLLLGGALSAAAWPLLGAPLAHAGTEHPMTGPANPPGGIAATSPSGATLTSGIVETESTFVGTAWTPYADELDTASDGDLWPTAWADDDALYTANGDGRGFSSDQPWADIAANRIDGTPDSGITGERLSAGDDIVRIWSGDAYNRKPTGIVAVDGNGDGKDELYLAVQDLRRPPAEGEPDHPHGFNEVPAATIVRSLDYGRTWEPVEEPMFTDHVYTTVFFLDFGKSNSGASVLGTDGADYVYAYGLDNNWRDSFSGIVDDPLDLWLARAPIGSILDRSTWEYFAGMDGDQPTWNADIAAREAVLHDERRVYPGAVTEDGNSVVSQGSVVYNPGLERYFYLSWTEYTWEFYEAPAPWGPWKLFMHKDFGPYPWWGAEPGTPGPKSGGYATVAPSKFISSDGQTMWVQANWFVGEGHPKNNYNFSLRKLTVTPYAESQPDNPGDAANNLARSADGTVVIDKTAHYGKPHALNDGETDLVEDSWDGSSKDPDLWGFEWPRAHHLDRIVYTTGEMHDNGGWFAEQPTVQVRQNHAWVDVSDLTVEPAYPTDSSAGPRRAYTFSFDKTWGDGVRLIGTPGGDATFTSIAELEVYFDG